VNFLRSLAPLVGITLVEHLLSIYLPLLLYVDLFLLYIVYRGLMASQITASYTGFVGGVVQDSISGLAIGINGFSKTVLGFGVSTLGRYIMLDSTWLRLAVVLSCSLLNSALVGGLLYILGQSMPEHTLEKASVQAVCTAVAGLALFGLADRMRRGTHKQLAKPYVD
jgi:rod shape-determining protein MreD